MMDAEKELPDLVALLRELLTKATPGGWEVWCGLNVRSMSGAAVCAGGMQRGEQKDGGDWENRVNMALITTMKNALPDLLDAAEELVRVRKWARQPSDCGSVCAADTLDGARCLTCTNLDRNFKHAGEPGWTDHFKPKWNRERRDIPPTQAFREMRKAFGLEEGPTADAWTCGICGARRSDVEPVTDEECGDACPEHFKEESHG